ncbi:hypothetical protein GCM10025865_02960 [Paraoerskovia sediminicola]|uniref:Uncharacterized protein n=1 Tax=Paraoerskovia sediminicola TaxID=1138587 RepID=A0ABN6XBG4_9CELL|nr:hypothetical protein GCM10025865_02960 [Paraoerskovia sediminicola]
MLDTLSRSGEFQVPSQHSTIRFITASDPSRATLPPRAPTWRERRASALIPQGPSLPEQAQTPAVRYDEMSAVVNLLHASAPKTTTHAACTASPSRSTPAST